MKCAAVLFAIAALVAASPATAADCFKSSKAVFERYGDDAGPKYTRRMKGHRGEECWFRAGDRFEHADRSERRHDRKEVMRNELPRQGSTVHESRPESATRAVGVTPVAKPALVIPGDEEKLAHGRRLLDQQTVWSQFDHWASRDHVLDYMVSWHYESKP